MNRVYYYTFKKGIFKVEEGELYVFKGFSNVYTRVRMIDSKRNIMFDGVYGKVLGKGGPHIWMTERDDELARSLFIEHEESMINDFLSKIEDKKKLIEILEKTRV